MNIVWFLLLSICASNKLVNSLFKSYKYNAKEEQILLERILSGDDAEILDWNFVVEIGWIEGHLCTGVLIDIKWVLTSAFCLHHPIVKNLMNVADIEVRCGSPTTGLGTLLNVEKIIVHPDFDINNVEYGRDLALIQLKDALAISARAAPIKLSYNSPVGTKICKTAGWGKISTVKKLAAAKNAYHPPDARSATTIGPLQEIGEISKLYSVGPIKPQTTFAEKLERRKHVYKTYEKIEVAHVKEKRQTQDDFLKLEVTVRPKHFTAFPKIFQPMGLIGPIGPISSIPSRPNIPPTSRVATQSTLRPSLGKVKPFLDQKSSVGNFMKPFLEADNEHELDWEMVKDPKKLEHKYIRMKETK